MAAEGITVQYLLNLKEQLRERGSAYQGLEDFLATGADRMAREADVIILQNLAARLMRHKEEAVSSEHGAQCVSIEGNMVGGVGGFMVKGLFSAIAGPIWREDAFEKERITRRTMRQNTFGTIMVCVSKGGLPDDVHIISISKISREHNRPETEIIRELRKRGETLFTLKLFDVILGTLNEKLAKGTLHLPISVQQLLAVVAIPSKITVTLLPSAK